MAGKLIAFTFLGSLRTPTREGYVPTRYRFGTDDPIEAEFFALALVEHLKAVGRPIDRLVVLGTTGTMWHTLALHLACGAGRHGEEEDAALLQLAADLEPLARVDGVTEAALAPLATAMTAATGIDCRLELIPYGETEAEQVTLLERMAAHVNAGDCIAFDLTHGLRHLPLLGFTSALVLQEAVGAEIEGIWSGAFELKRRHGDVSPAIRLDGLMRIGGWIGALHAYERTGDVRAFVPPLEAEGMDQTPLRRLRRAGGFEMLLRVHQARQPAREVLERLEARPPEGVGRLFTGRLRERLAWARADGHSRHQADLARRFLAHGDHLRATLATYEAFVSRLVEEQERRSGTPGDPTAFRVRDDARAEFLQGALTVPGDRAAQSAAFDRLRRLRNALAHTSHVHDAEIINAMDNPSSLDRFLGEIVDTLLPPTPDTPP